MKTYRPFLVFLMSAFTVTVFAQSGDKRSAKEEAQYDAACIDANIADSRDIMHFSRAALDKSRNPEITELATTIQGDLTEVLYEMEQLAVSGAAASGNRVEPENGTFEQAGVLNDALESAREFKFDTTWSGGLFRLFQFKLDALAIQKEKVTNPRLKTAVTSAISVFRRTLPRLSSLQKQLIRQDLQEKKEAARREKEEKQRRKAS